MGLDRTLPQASYKSAGNARLALAILLPFIACAVQWLLWDAIKPYVWFLFFPAAFFSAWIGGFRGGLTGTAISALLVWFFFIPPTFSLELKNLSAGFSVIIFIFMGGLFTFFFERLQQAQRRTGEALAAAEAANEKITQLYQKTLELDALKNQFFANVSHELRTPLTLILAPLEQRLRRPDGPQFLPAERLETEIMLRNARLLYRHVTDLLDAAKLDAGRMTLAWARFDLVRLARAMASNFELLAAERGIAYAVTAPDTLAVEADGEKLQRVLLNLLSNAFKFTPDGGTIVLRLSEHVGHALIEVQDNGPGVPTALREAVFERFRQAVGDARRRHGGTGLGLAIVKDFVALHGGAVSLEEAPGGGALFSVRLPLAAPVGTVLGSPLALDEIIDRQAVEELEVSATSAPPAQASAAADDAPLVLVVEDNADMNEFVCAALRPHYRVASAHDGRAGMEQAVALKPDLILSDVMMPVMSGDEMVAELRRLPAMENVPIVMLTAKADDALRLRLFESGVQAYLSKPFAVEELLTRVGGLVTARRRTVAELSRSEQALQEREATFRSLFDNMLNGFAYCRMLFDGEQPRDFVYLSVNKAFETLTGLNNVVGRMVTEVLPGIRESDPELFEVYGRVSRTGQPERLERYVQALQMWFWISVYTPKFEHFVAVFDVITERKQAEEEIRRLNVDLERRVVERTAELSAANRELDSFAYAVSHDLRAPLRAMSGFSQALAEDYGDRLDGEAKKYLDQIDLASRNMGELIDGILTLSRSTRGELQRDTIDLTALAARLLEELARGDPARNVGWQVEPGLQAIGDTRMVEVAMRNLLGNAWKYTGKTEAPSIRVSSGKVGGLRGYCVADNGAGFNMDYANRLFQPFQRLHRQDEFPGIGIGLATVQRIIYRHGGDIRAEGCPGAGATFCFTLLAGAPEETS